MDSDAAAEVNDAITLLTGHREPKYRDEQVICLARLQAYIYFPDEPDLVESARIVAGGLLLSQRYRSFVRHQEIASDPPSAVTARVLSLPEYAAIFNAILPDGDHVSTLLGSIRPSDFTKRLAIRWESAPPIANMIDYRYRLLHHQQGKRSEANISHSWVFSFKQKQLRPVSGRTLRTWWATLQHTAVFIYAIERFWPVLAPEVLPGRIWLRRLQKIAKDQGSLQRFLGICVYVANQLYDVRQHDQSIAYYPDDDILQPVRPPTKRLSAAELGLLKNYQEDLKQFRG